MMIHVARYVQKRLNEALMFRFYAHMIAVDEILP